MGSHYFGVPRDFVLWLKQTFALRHFIETGTNLAESSVWASANFESVTTVEAHQPLFDAAQKEYGRIRNIEFLLGDSREHLQRLAPALSEPAIFWLDAHWCGDGTFGRMDECPVLGELRAIGASPVAHFILIDDARFFLAPPPPPHAAEHWPGIGEICAELRGHGSEPYVAIHDDVIIAAPRTARRQLVEYLGRRAVPTAALDRQRPTASAWRKLKAMWR